MNEYGSFEWYKKIKDDFFLHLTRAIMHADGDNTIKLRKVFPHICMAYRVNNWENSPEIHYPVTINITKSFPKHKDCFSNIDNEGTFARYLHRSGHFVTALANTIAYSDEHNLELIFFQFPQMVEAYRMSSWDMCPKGFESDTYNSPQKILQKT